MNASLSVDPDGLCAYFLKKSSFSICKPLAHIFMISYETENIPDFWKKALVIPLHKKR